MHKKRTNKERREKFINGSLISLFIGISIFVLAILYGIIGIPILVFAFGVFPLIVATPLVLSFAVVALIWFGGVAISLLCS